MKSGAASHLVQTVSIIDTISQLASNGHTGLDSLKSLSSSSPTPSKRSSNGSGRLLPRSVESRYNGVDQVDSTQQRSLPFKPGPVNRFSPGGVSGPVSLHRNGFLGSSQKPEIPPRNNLHQPQSLNAVTANSRSFNASTAGNSSANPKPVPPLPSFIANGSASSGRSNGPQSSTPLRFPGRRRRAVGRRRPGAGSLGGTGGGGESETPDWIKQLFSLTRAGNLEKLSTSLADTEKNILRNMSDHRGNNLVHTSCQFGHTHILAWLANSLGKEMESALSDENRAGLSPPIIAIKYGRQETLAWLVRHSRTADRLQSRDGERCLLHYAAKYGQDGIVNWLGNEMVEAGLDLDQMDMGGNTPLHLAARSGRTKSGSTLLSLGASVNMKNDMGMKPSDVANLRGKDDTAEFLLMFETSLGLTRDLLTNERNKDAMQQENSDFKSSFREMLSVSKKLASEREEMISELHTLKEMVDTLHNTIQSDESRSEVSSYLSTCSDLRDHLDSYKNNYFTSSLADLEHRIILADDNVRKPRPVNNQNIENSYCHRHLRDRLEETRGQNSSLSFTSVGLNSSPSSLSEVETDLSDLEDVRSPEDKADAIYESMKNVTNIIQRRKKLSTPSPGKIRPSPPPLPLGASSPTPSRSRRDTKSESSLSESMYSSVGSPIYSAIGGTTDSPSSGLDYNTAKITATELIRSSNGPVTNGSPSESEEKLQRRERLRLQLQQLALTSDTGTASVVEVIEPDSSEEEELKKTFSWTPSNTQQQQNSTSFQLVSGSSNQSSSITTTTMMATDITVTSTDSGQMSLLPMYGGGSSNAGVNRHAMMMKNSGSMSLALTPSGQPLAADYGQMSLKDSGQERLEKFRKERGGEYSHMFVSKRSMGHVNNIKPKFQSLDANGRKMSEPDILHGVQAFSRNEERRNSANILDEMKPENGEEEIFGDYDPESLSSELLERPDSILAGRKRGFLKKLSIAKWAGRRKGAGSSKDNESDNESVTPLRKSVDDLREDGVGQDNSVRTRDHSVTRIRVPSNMNGRSPGASEIRSMRNRSQGDGRTNDRSGIISTKTSMARSDDSGIIATSSRPDSSLSTPAIRKSYSGSSDNSDLSSRSATSSSGKLEVGSTTSTIQLNGGVDNNLSADGNQSIRSDGSADAVSTSSNQTTTIVISSTPSAHGGRQIASSIESAKPANNNVQPQDTTERRAGRRTEKAWYDVSDEETDITQIDQITNIISVRASSDDDVF